MPSAERRRLGVSVLAGVTCTSPTSCFAVGGVLREHADSSAELTLVEKLERHDVVDRRQPEPGRRRPTASSRAWRARARTILLRGRQLRHRSIVTNTLIEHWDGTTWTVVPSPNPAELDVNELSGDRARARRSAPRSGIGPRHAGRALERYDLVDREERRTRPARPGLSLTGVSCPSVARCFAVGDHLPPDRRAAPGRDVERRELVDGQRSGARRAPRSATSAASRARPASSCFAVGDFRLGPSRRPLLERYS